MPSAAAIRMQVEAALAKRVPAALTPVQRQIRPVQPTSIKPVDDLIGGFPEGAITELSGPEGSGRMSLALAFLAQISRQGSACAWVDATDGLDTETVSAAGIELNRLLWVRCGVQDPRANSNYVFRLPENFIPPRQPKRGLHGGGFGPHPRTETKGLSGAMGELFPHNQIPDVSPVASSRASQVSEPATAPRKIAPKPWLRIEQALKATDLILHAGGFAAVVLDFGSIAPEQVSRVEQSVWFRYRAAVERTQASLVLLTRHPCAKSAGELLLRLQSGVARRDGVTVFKGVERRLEVERRRFADNLITLKKQPQGTQAAWTTSPAWEVG